MKKKPITGEQIGLIFSGITALFLLVMPYALKTIPDFASGNQTAELMRENVNMTAAYILLALIPFVIVGWIWAFKRAGRKSDIDGRLEQLEQQMNQRFDAIDRKLGIFDKEDSKNGKPKPKQ